MVPAVDRLPADRRRHPVRKYLYVRWNLLWRLFFGYDGREAPPKEAAEPSREPALDQV